MAIDDTEPKTIEAVVRVGIESALLDLRTIHPCKIIKVRGDGTVDVDLMVHTVFIDGSNDSLPSITQLPILYSGNDQYSITFPVAVGDEGLALFAERDISLYLENGETGPPNALRRHDLSDGLFLPMPISKPKRLGVVADTLLLANGSTSIEVTAGLIKMNGDVEINGNSSTSGNVEADGEVTALAAVPAVSVSLSTHFTTGVTPGGGNSTAPLPGT